MLVRTGPWRDGVDGDVVGREIDRRAPRAAMDKGFSCTVVSDAGSAFEADVRAEEDRADRVPARPGV